MDETNQSRPRSLELGILAAATLVCLLPFVRRAYHVDDTLFVWTAQQICQHPLDFYGFRVDWYTTWEPMSRVTQNPPAGGYYLALVGSLFGWSEIALHLSMLLLAWGMIWGTYRLAERFASPPLPAALVTLLTPAVLVCGTSVMCDVPMLCLWLWTILLWDRAVRSRNTAGLCLAGTLIALTTVTKYFGVCLLPLLGVYSYAVDRDGWRRWAVGLGMAALLLAAYQVAFTSLYAIDRGLTGAMGYAAVTKHTSVGGWAFQLFEGLGFIGGCFGLAAVPAIFLLTRRSALIVSCVVVAAALAAHFLTGITIYPGGLALADSPFAATAEVPLPPGVSWQFLIWVAAGTAVLLLAIEDWRIHRCPVALLLLLWIMGTALFATYVNWALNGRSVLPMIPAVAIVLSRRLAREPRHSWLLPLVLAPAAALALAVTFADTLIASAHRTAAQGIVAEYQSPPGRPLWFEGHWGFQYYMQAAGAKPWDWNAAEGRVGDLLVVPHNNCLVFPVDEFAELVATVDVSGCSWAATMRPFVGCGWYACNFAWRPLPFVFGPMPSERFEIRRLTKDQKPDPKQPAS
jgi:4-amino-4-deoxy-L-arabinose transferase-like glycosyltransferase